METLETRIMDPPSAGDGTLVVILMHGRGADAGDLASLRRWLPDHTSLVLPRAPFAAAPWGYGPGRAWYRYEGEDRPEEESFRSAQESLDALLSELPDRLGYRPGALVVGGFSQGGTMALGHALRRPGSVTGVLNFSGFVPAHPDVTISAGTVKGTRFFWGHGTEDPAIPHALAERGRERLREAGADLEARDYRMGHGIAREELEDAVRWLERIGRPEPARQEGGG